MIECCLLFESLHSIRKKFNFNIIGFYSILMSVLLQYFRSNSITIGAQSKEKSCILKDSYVIKMLQNVIKTFKKHSEKLVSRKASLLHLVNK